MDTPTYNPVLFPEPPICSPAERISKARWALVSECQGLLSNLLMPTHNQALCNHCTVIAITWWQCILWERINKQSRRLSMRVKDRSGWPDAALTSWGFCNCRENRSISKVPVVVAILVRTNKSHFNGIVVARLYAGKSAYFGVCCINVPRAQLMKIWSILTVVHVDPLNEWKTKNNYNTRRNEH